MYLKFQGALQLVELAMAYCVVTRDERLVDERGFEPPGFLVANTEREVGWREDGCLLVGNVG